MTESKIVYQWKTIVYPLSNSSFVKCLLKFCYLLKTFGEITTTAHIWTSFMPFAGWADQESSTEHQMISKTVKLQTRKIPSYENCHPHSTI